MVNGSKPVPRTSAMTSSPTVPTKLAALTGLAIFAAALPACVKPAQHASIAALQYRGAVDLKCHPQQLGVYHVDRRTTVVAGCASRGVYVESCELFGDRTICTWRLDAPLVTPDDTRKARPAPRPCPVLPQPIACPPHPEELAGTPRPGFVVEPMENWE
jgi:hypothetical protein